MSISIAPRLEIIGLGINVKDEGAKGDGTTDDTAAFLSAINRANGQMVYVPTGDYRVALTALTDQAIWLSGPGRLLQRQSSQVIKVARSLGASRAVTSVASVQLGVNVPSSAILRTETCSAIFPTADCSDIRNGDKLFLASQDFYAYDVFGNGNKTYQCAWFPVHGLGLNLTTPTNGGVLENNLVVGGTSGATAYARGASSQQDGSQILVFTSVSGAFTAGETLSVGGQARGTVSGVLYILMADRLVDQTWVTSPVFYKPTKALFRLGGGIRFMTEASSDTNSPAIGSAARLPTLELRHLIDAEIDVIVEGSFTRAVQLNACFGADVKARISSAPNDDINSAYGYGVETYGAAENNRIQVIATNCRHAFTNNVESNSNYSFVDLARAGVPKYNKVYGSIAYGSIAAGFDTHAGGYFQEFNDCTVHGLNGGCRKVTTTAGFQNRSFGTKFINCRSINTVRGFYDSAGNWAPPVPHTIELRDCVFENYQEFGLRIEASSATNTRYQIEGCTAIGDGGTVNLPYYQSGFAFKGCNVTVQRCTSRRFNGAPFSWDGAGGRGNFIDCLADYSEGPGSAGALTGFRFDAIPSEMNVIGYKIRLNPFAPTNITGAFRIESVMSMTHDGVTFFGGADQPFKTGAGTLTATIKTKVTA